LKAGAARAELDRASGLDAARGVEDHLEERGQSLYRFLGARMFVRGIVAGRHAVHVLAIELQARRTTNRGTS
jgi:hypothetical protein